MKDVYYFWRYRRQLPWVKITLKLRPKIFRDEPLYGVIQHVYRPHRARSAVNHISLTRRHVYV